MLYLTVKIDDNCYAKCISLLVSESVLRVDRVFDWRGVAILLLSLVVRHRVTG